MQVNLNGSRTGDGGLEKISAGLHQCRNLKKLALNNTGLTTRSATTLRYVVSCLPRLEKLYIGGNCLHDSGMEQLASGLQHCTVLTILDVHNTKLSARSVPVICHLLTSLHQLFVVRISGNGFADSDRMELHRSVQRTVPFC